MTFLVWHDDSKRVPVPERIADGVERYRQRMGKEPNVVLVHPSEVCEVAGLEVRPGSYVRPNNYWIGREGGVDGR